MCIPLLPLYRWLLYPLAVSIWICSIAIPVSCKTGHPTTNTHRHLLLPSRSSYACAFAGGDGFGLSSNKKDKTTKKNPPRKDKETENDTSISTSIKDMNLKKRGRLFIDSNIQIPSPPPHRDQDKVSSSQQQHQSPPLDRFGLPILTAENFFPPLPPETEFIGIPTKHQLEEQITVPCLQTIQQAMNKHIPINFHIFDEYGIEKKNTSLNAIPWKLKLLHQSPPVLYIENFLTPQECQEILSLTKPISSSNSNNSSNNTNNPIQVQSATFASTYAISKRTSTSWFCPYQIVPTFLAKAKRLFAFTNLDTMEEPQIVRYRIGEEFSWHYDEIPISQLMNGGQRVATLLVYLNTLSCDGGGGTIFRDLIPPMGSADNQGLTVQPTIGHALLFFPAFANGQPDDRTLHKGEVIRHDEKYIIQMWIHEKKYQAILPQGNKQEDAIQGVLEKERQLGYI